MNKVQWAAVSCAIVALFGCGAESELLKDSQDARGASSSALQSKSTDNLLQTAATAKTTPALLRGVAEDYPSALAVGLAAQSNNNTTQAEPDPALANNPEVFQATLAGMQKVAPAVAAEVISPNDAVIPYSSVYRLKTTAHRSAYFHSLKMDEKRSLLQANPEWVSEGDVFYGAETTGPDLFPVVRYKNKLTGAYVYAIEDADKAVLDGTYRSAYEKQGNAWYARKTAAPGWFPLYRFRNNLNGFYVYTANETEKSALVSQYANVFTYQGIALYVRKSIPDYINYAKNFDSTNSIDIPNFGKVVANEIIAARKKTVTHAQIATFVSQNGWSIVGYSQVTRRYQFQIPAVGTTMEVSKLFAEATNLFDYVDFNRVIPRGGLASISDIWSDVDLATQSKRWHLDEIKLQQAMEIFDANARFQFTEPTPVGVIDGGFRSDHDDLSFSEIYNGYTESGVLRSVNKAENCNGYTCDNEESKRNANHGMHVAGIIGASHTTRQSSANSGLGGAGVAGSNASIFGFQGLLSTQFQVDTALEAAIRSGFGNRVNGEILNKSRVINISAGYQICSFDTVFLIGDACIPDQNGETSRTLKYDTLEKFSKLHSDWANNVVGLLDQFDRQGKILFIQAAGNAAEAPLKIKRSVEGEDTWEKHPADFTALFASVISNEMKPRISQEIIERIQKQTIIVGATTSNKNTGNYSSKPSTHYPSNALLNSYMLAPGSDIWSSVYTGSKNNYDWNSGTSMAAPMVSGAAAVLMRAKPDADANQIKNLLLNSETKIEGYPMLDLEYSLKSSLGLHQKTAIAKLTWSDSTAGSSVSRDLDSHLIRITSGVVDYHLYYGKRTVNGVMDSLDLDDTSYEGPETITFTPIPSANYSYYVHNFIGGSTSLMLSNPSVYVQWDGQPHTITPPPGSSTTARYWRVFDIKNGQFIRCTQSCLQDLEPTNVKRLSVGAQVDKSSDENSQYVPALFAERLGRTKAKAVQN